MTGVFVETVKVLRNNNPGIAPRVFKRAVGNLFEDFSRRTVRGKSLYYCSESLDHVVPGITIGNREHIYFIQVFPVFGNIKISRQETMVKVEACNSMCR